MASLAYAGGPSPEGNGRIPNITPDQDTGIGSWSEDDIVTLLETGFTPIVRFGRRVDDGGGAATPPG